ncbi:MAG: hypothetical protein ACRD4L_10605, partial [Pyrinomonadaceae bacterium]
VLSYLNQWRLCWHVATICSIEYFVKYTLVKFKLSDTRLPDGSRLPAAESEGLYQFTLANDSGKLDRDSPFVKEALAKLREYLTNSDKASPSAFPEIQAKPTTPLEKEIATALALAMKDK